MKILYEDNHIIVVEKKPGIPSQGDKTEDKDMLTMIKEYLKEKYNKPGNVYLGLVHRLDRPVGGVMVFAKTSKAASRLSEQVRNKDFNKTYLVVVNGRMEEQKATIEDYLWKDQQKNTSYVVRENKKNSKKAVLDYEVLKYDEKENVSVLKVNLHTGRHHQIRVQLSNRKHSIIGDGKYHGRELNGKMYLWAYQLEFIHPTTKERLTFTDLPEMKGMWEELKDISGLENNIY